MDDAGETAGPPREIISNEVLELASIYDNTMYDESVSLLARTLGDETPEDVLFGDDPALWRAFALLELLHIIPDPKKLRPYAESALVGMTTNQRRELLFKIKTVREKATHIANSVLAAYMLLLEDDPDTIAIADKNLEQFQNTDIVRVLGEMRNMAALDPDEHLLMARTVASLLTAQN